MNFYIVVLFLKIFPKCNRKQDSYRGSVRCEFHRSTNEFLFRHQKTITTTTNNKVIETVTTNSFDTLMCIWIQLCTQRMYGCFIFHCLFLFVFSIWKCLYIVVHNKNWIARIVKNHDTRNNGIERKMTQCCRCMSENMKQLVRSHCFLALAFPTHFFITYTYCVCVNYESWKTFVNVANAVAWLWTGAHTRQTNERTNGWTIERTNERTSDYSNIIWWWTTVKWLVHMLVSYQYVSLFSHFHFVFQHAKRTKKNTNRLRFNCLEFPNG